MTRPERSAPPGTQPALDPGERRFVERLRTAFAPEPESAARRAAFACALRERIETASRSSWTGWRLAPAAAGFALSLAVWLGLGVTPPAPGPLARPQATQLASLRAPSARADALAWEESLFFPAADPAREQADLPNEYQAIAVAFFGSER